MKMICDLGGVTFVGIGMWSVFSDELQLSVFAMKKINWEVKYFYPKNTPNKSLNGLSVEEYKLSKKEGLLEIAKPAQILKAMDFFHKEMNKLQE